VFGGNEDLYLCPLFVLYHRKKLMNNREHYGKKILKNGLLMRVSEQYETMQNYFIGTRNPKVTGQILISDCNDQNTKSQGIFHSCFEQL
jgi:hypothetical protein